MKLQKLILCQQTCSGTASFWKSINIFFSSIKKTVCILKTWVVPKNSKWMKDLNVRQETVKILEEKTGNNLFDLGHSNFLLDMSLKARELKAKMNYWDLIKIKKLLHSKGNNQQN